MKPSFNHAVELLLHAHESQVNELQKELAKRDAELRLLKSQLSEYFKRFGSLNKGDSAIQANFEVISPSSKESHPNSSKNVVSSEKDHIILDFEDENDTRFVSDQQNDIYNPYALLSSSKPSSTPTLPKSDSSTIFDVDSPDSTSKKRKSSEKRAPTPVFENLSEKPNFKFHEVVRGKEARKALEGRECHECGAFLDALGLQDDARKHFLKCSSRHRSKHPAPSTPPHIWSISFPSDEIDEVLLNQDVIMLDESIQEIEKMNEKVACRQNSADKLTNSSKHHHQDHQKPNKYNSDHLEQVRIDESRNSFNQKENVANTFDHYVESSSCSPASDSSSTSSSKSSPSLSSSISSTSSSSSKSFQKIRKISTNNSPFLPSKSSSRQLSIRRGENVD